MTAVPRSSCPLPRWAIAGLTSRAASTPAGLGCASPPRWPRSARRLLPGFAHGSRCPSDRSSRSAQRRGVPTARYPAPRRVPECSRAAGRNTAPARSHSRWQASARHPPGSRRFNTGPKRRRPNQPRTRVGTRLHRDLDGPNNNGSSRSNATWDIDSAYHPNKSNW